MIPVFAVILLSCWIADKWPVLAFDDLAALDDQKRLCVLPVVEHDVEGRILAVEVFNFDFHYCGLCKLRRAVLTFESRWRSM